MSQTSSQHNPFMLMIAPEVILAAIEKSERLGKLNRHLCRPLDRPMPTPAGARTATSPAVDAEDDDESHSA